MVLSAEVVMPHVCFFVACEKKKCLVVMLGIEVKQMNLKESKL